MAHEPEHLTGQALQVFIGVLAALEAFSRSRHIWYANEPGADQRQ